MLKRRLNLESRAVEALNIWTVYHGFSERFGTRRYGARRFIVSAEGQSFTDELLVSDRLDELRNELARRGLVRLDRLAEDDAQIVEVWL